MNTASRKTPEARFSAPPASTLFSTTMKVRGYEKCRFDSWSLLSNKDEGKVKRFTAQLHEVPKTLNQITFKMALITATF